eukprot:11509-Heterococcus_DN1.PRE.4
MRVALLIPVTISIPSQTLNCECAPSTPLYTTAYTKKVPWKTERATTTAIANAATTAPTTAAVVAEHTT